MNIVDGALKWMENVKGIFFFFFSLRLCSAEAVPSSQEGSIYERGRVGNLMSSLHWWWVANQHWTTFVTPESSRLIGTCNGTKLRVLLQAWNQLYIPIFKRNVLNFSLVSTFRTITEFCENDNFNFNARRNDRIIF